MNEREKKELTKAVTDLVENIWYWQNKAGVITLRPGSDADDDFHFGSGPACEAEDNIIVARFEDVGWLEDWAGISENCSEEDKKLGIKIICASIEKDIKDGCFDDLIDEDLEHKEEAKRRARDLWDEYLNTWDLDEFCEYKGLKELSTKSEIELAVDHDFEDNASSYRNDLINDFKENGWNWDIVDTYLITKYMKDSLIDRLFSHLN